MNSLRVSSHLPSGNSGSETKIRSSWRFDGSELVDYTKPPEVCWLNLFTVRRPIRLRWPSFCRCVYFIHTLTPLCSLLCFFSLPSPFYLLFRCSPFQYPVIVSGRLIVASCGEIAWRGLPRTRLWPTWSRQRKRELFSLLRLLFD